MPRTLRTFNQKVVLGQPLILVFIHARVIFHLTKDLVHIFLMLHNLVLVDTCYQNWLLVFVVMTYSLLQEYQRYHGLGTVSPNLYYLAGSYDPAGLTLTFQPGVVKSHETD